MTTLTLDRAVVHSHDQIRTDNARPVVPKRCFLDFVLEDMSPDERGQCLDFLEGEARDDLNFAALKEVRSCRRDGEY